ncbi:MULTISPECIES: hypothetical protein [Paenibacillus]|uniref:hypothetical protein n=1 Tax=Paenibacillus TaxID=44249 RepID=UPI00048DE56D|nr:MULTISPECIES: hypothetical protein [Paenibacillus]APB77167.1 hypothetical protein PPYC2_20360 [Paenibacillus polymyxa]OMF75740.1 hypothetical protein BK143_05095 [Paenibacillus peoriae]OMF82875.1 hypothetical protein BK145_05450 [Paenibacillus peoriae]POR30351.1 hypothetical protein CG775_04550 [Paenibacillus polymyxa]SFR02148.1 hypothetical protein SAMN04488603_1011107 [Paenibacillus sp. cl130]
MKYFAQYNNDCVIFAVSQSIEAPAGDKVIEVNGYEVLGSKFHPDTGDFERIPAPNPRPSVEEKLQEEIEILKQADLDNKETIAGLIQFVMSQQTDV